MANKRKRSAVDAESATKKPKPVLPVKRDLLQQCYAQVHTLRDYLLGKLPSTSRLRRKKIASVGAEASDIEAKLAKLLDNALVCSTERPDSETQDLRWQQWLGFSQQAGDESYVTISGTPEAASHCQTGIVDFVIWLLFSRSDKSNKWPKHLLCDGFRKGAGNGENGGCNIPGLFSRFPNSNVKTLKDAPWPQMLALLGKSGERIMIDMLVDCAVFPPVDAGYGNYYQLSGYPLSEVDIQKRTSNGGQELPSICRKLSDITLVRSRIFYAKPALTSEGIVQAGFKHIHVLNRCPRLKIPDEASSADKEASELKNLINITKVMMYIFPRQFSLHNVFTSEVDRKQTAQKFQDYTLREDEIKAVTQTKGSNICLPKTPKRLRHATEHLVERLQILHARCSYLELLRHYCPTSFDPPRRAPGEAIAKPRKTKSRPQPSQMRPRGRRSIRGTQTPHEIRYNSIAELACPVAHVSAFCQAALSKVIPNGFWGEGDTGEHNKKMVMKKVHHFVKLKRFETMSLHEIAQDLKIVDIPWLRPPRLQGLKTSQTDINKRYEIFHEFLYYIFDSFLMPLIRSNFYVTESNTHRYQIFYFRHDVWKRIAEPAMAALKDKMFEEVKTAEATQILSSRNLGFSNVRLLPKGKDLRPIMNLRKRALGVGRDRAAALGLSINTLLGPVHTALKLEQRTNPSKLGSTLFSVNDIYTKLKDFRTSLGPDHGPLYFAKLDIRAAFDTIPQEAVVRLMSSVPTQDQYTIVKHAEIKPAERTVIEAGQTATKPMRKWRAQALGRRDTSKFATRLENNLATKKKNTIFIDSTMRSNHERKNLVALLKEHVTNNLVKIGKKYYRQKTGIPQGSVLSSFLANYFYADLEVHYLDFLAEDCLLLRLIDDFLLITLDQDKAKRFVEILHAGVPDYGVEVNPIKTLVNFDMEDGGASVRKFTSPAFPYCGTTINTRTLEIMKDREKSKSADMSNSLTIEFGRAPGQNFERKVLNAFKIQSHLMFFDTTHNSAKTVLSTLHGAFTETATKMWAYVRSMPKTKQPKASLVIRTIAKVIDVAFLLLTSRSRKMRFEDYECDIRKGQVALTAYRAFLEVFEKKQAGYAQVTAWLRKEQTRLGSK